MNGILDYLAKQNDRAVEYSRMEEHTRSLQSWDGCLPKPLKIEADEADDNVLVNYSTVVVEEIVTMLFGEDLGIQIGTEAEEPADAWLAGRWPLVERQTDLIDMAINGAIFGHVWVKLVIGNDQYPRVVVLDPMNMSAEWSPTDWRDVTLYRCQYNTVEAGTGKAVVMREDYRPDGNRWVISYFEKYADQKQWRGTGEQVWPYPFAPIYQEKNLPKPNEFYGMPDLTKAVVDLIQSISAVDGFSNRILRNHANPKPIAKGMRPQDLKVGSKNALFLPSPDQDIKLLEMQSDLTGLANFRRLLREGLAETTRVPEIAVGKIDGVSQLSGRALQILYGPLVRRTKLKRRYYGRLITDIVKGVLAVGGYSGLPITLKWPDLLPDDPQELAMTLQAHRQLGVVSIETVAEKLGYNLEAEQKKIDLENERLRDAAAQDQNVGL